ncbi:MAG TPA: alpha/beta fold hydrolase [Candidatus Dormibacteraeota bacterium]|nr:alpha/beta fold hydrolase [Candidatus Dormibacteraeota bacterium]
MAAVKTGFTHVNGLEIYYEVHGQGDPLVLLHGGVAGIANIESLLPGLSARRQVIAVELQGHGRTSDSDRPLSFEAMADDVAGVLAEMGIERADWMGYSLGGGTALRAVIRHPQTVRRLVLVATPFARNGWHPEVLVGMGQMVPAAEGMKRSPLAKLYPRIDWEVLFTKLRDLLAQDYDLSGEVAAIKAPTMLVFADADSIRPAHMIEFFRLLGGGMRDGGLDGSLRPVSRLAILPGYTHYDICGSPVLPDLVNAFLEASL